MPITKYCHGAARCDKVWTKWALMEPFNIKFSPGALIENWSKQIELMIIILLRFKFGYFTTHWIRWENILYQNFKNVFLIRESTQSER